MRPGKEERTASLIVSRNVIGQKIKREDYTYIFRGMGCGSVLIIRLP